MVPSRADEHRYLLRFLMAPSAVIDLLIEGGNVLR